MKLFAEIHGNAVGTTVIRRECAVNGVKRGRSRELETYRVGREERGRIFHAIHSRRNLIKLISAFPTSILSTYEKTRAEICLLLLALRNVGQRQPIHLPLHRLGAIARSALSLIAQLERTPLHGVNLVCVCVCAYTRAPSRRASTRCINSTRFHVIGTKK